MIYYLYGILIGFSTLDSRDRIYHVWLESDNTSIDKHNQSCIDNFNIIKEEILPNNCFEIFKVKEEKNTVSELYTRYVSYINKYISNCQKFYGNMIISDSFHIPAFFKMYIEDIKLIKDTKLFGYCNTDETIHLNFYSNNCVEMLDIFDNSDILQKEFKSISEKENLERIKNNMKNKQSTEKSNFDGTLFHDRYISTILNTKFKIRDVKFSGSTTIVYWFDGTYTVVTMDDTEKEYDIEKAIMAAYMKKLFSYKYENAKARTISTELDKWSAKYESEKEEIQKHIQKVKERKIKQAEEAAKLTDNSK